MGEHISERERSALATYVTLFRQFVAGSMSADEFETTFLDAYKNDPTLWSGSTFDTLDAVFADVDDYTGDASLRARAGGLDAEQLRERVRKALAALTELVGDGSA